VSAVTLAGAKTVVLVVVTTRLASLLAAMCVVVILVGVESDADGQGPLL
jgi:Na+/H+-dicarboxylate symporter